MLGGHFQARQRSLDAAEARRYASCDHRLRSVVPVAHCRSGPCRCRQDVPCRVDGRLRSLLDADLPCRRDAHWGWGGHWDWAVRHRGGRLRGVRSMGVRCAVGERTGRDDPKPCARPRGRDCAGWPERRVRAAAVRQQALALRLWLARQVQLRPQGQQVPLRRLDPDRPGGVLLPGARLLRGSGDDGCRPRCGALLQRQSVRCLQRRGHRPEQEPFDGLRLLQPKDRAGHAGSMRGDPGRDGPTLRGGHHRPVRRKARQPALEPPVCASRRPPSSARDRARCRRDCPALDHP